MFENGLGSFPALDTAQVSAPTVATSGINGERTTSFSTGAFAVGTGASATSGSFDDLTNKLLKGAIVLLLVLTLFKKGSKKK